VCACSPGAREYGTLQSLSSRREDAGQNRRHPHGIGAIKLVAGPRYHLQRFAPICTQTHRLTNLAPDGQPVSVAAVTASLELARRLSTARRPSAPGVLRAAKFPVS